MKPFIKILLVCIVIFSACLYIAKVSIDSTFEKIECVKIIDDSPSPILKKIIEV